LETCETINGSWGYNITDRNYKTVSQVIRLLAGAAGRNANLLLNVGPMPNGAIQTEFADTLAVAGKWLQQYGESIYGTRGGPLAPQTWGVSTQKGNFIYLHFFKMPSEEFITLPISQKKPVQVHWMDTGDVVNFKKEKESIRIETSGMEISGPDRVLRIELK
jgi:alpha-L-fucosidase